MDLAISVQCFESGLERDMRAMFIRFGNNAKLGGIVNVMGDTHGKTMS